MSKRPEDQAPPELYYNDEEAKKYTVNSHIIEVQREITQRAIELCNLPVDETCMILDVGCGSGLSGECLTEHGHVWMGIDISQSMLTVAKNDIEVEGDLVLNDMGQGLPFRSGMFDGVISISALQWLCNADKSSHSPPKRMLKFFTMLYSVMARGAVAVFQLYPRDEQSLELLQMQALKAGFHGGVLVDFPHSTRAKKIYLVLFAGGVQKELPQAQGVEEKNSVINTARSAWKGKSNPKGSYKDWVKSKKERRERKGLEVRPNSKYTARRRNRKGKSD